jgi:glycosyltransferase involved in cell wall biosynthesis
MRRLAKLVRREKPDLIHGYLIFPNILATLLALVCRPARAAWGIRDSNVAPERYDRLEHLLYRVECRLSRFADIIIVNSKAGLEYAAANGFPRDKMKVIPNGIDTNRFVIDRPAGRKLRVEWGVADDEVLIGMVGRLDPVKDHATFIKAAAALACEREGLRFICLGSGPSDYRQELVDLSSKLFPAKRIVWADARADMPSVYNALDMVVSSSFCGEGFSNVIGEAMACGLPCVVTDVGDARRIVGELGEVVPPKSPEMLKSGIERFLKKVSADDARARSRDRIVENFSLASLIDRTEKSLLSLYSNRGDL